MKRSTIKIIEELFTKNPTLAFEAAKFKQKIVNNEIDKVLLHSLMQKTAKFDEINLYDAYCLKNIFNLYETGLLGICKINLGSTPFKNDAIEENNEVLSNLLPKFESKFIPEAGAGATSDGYFNLLEGSIEVTYKNGTIKKVEALSLPLEVGTTEADTTYEHFYERGGVARWAYYSEEIVILYLEKRLRPLSIFDKYKSNDFSIRLKREIPNKEFFIDVDKSQEEIIEILEGINSEIKFQNIPTNVYLRYDFGQLVALINFSKFECIKTEKERPLLNCLLENGLASNHVALSDRPFSIKINTHFEDDYDWLGISIDFL